MIIRYSKTWFIDFWACTKYPNTIVVKDWSRICTSCFSPYVTSACYDISCSGMVLCVSIVHMMQFVCLCLTKGRCHHYSVEHHLPFGWLLEKSTDILRERFFQHWLHRFSRLAPHIHPEPEWVGSIRSLWPRSNTSNGSGEQAHLSLSLSSLSVSLCLI